MVWHNLLKGFAIPLSIYGYVKPDIPLVVFSLFIKIALDGEGHLEIRLLADYNTIFRCEISLYFLLAHKWIVST